MFAGEALTLLVYHYMKRKQAREAAAKGQLQDGSGSVITSAGGDLEAPLLTEDSTDSTLPTSRTLAPVLGGNADPAGMPSSAPAWIFLLPAICDLLGTTLAGIGLLWVSASVWQMLRGSIIIFSGVFSVVFLKRKLSAHNWIGILLTAGGLAVVGTASLLAASGESDDADESQGKVLLGYLFIILGQLCAAVQMVVEETFLKNRNLEASLVVGMEGLWGLVLMFAAVFPVIYYIPGDDNGSYEDAIDAAYMISNNTSLLWMCILYWLSIAFYNFFGLSVTKYLSTIHRSLVDGLRTTLVWTVSLFIYYVVDEKLGEEWTDYSWMQLGGFSLLLIGALVYNKVLKLPCLNYEVPVAK